MTWTKRHEIISKRLENRGLKASPYMSGKARVKYNDAWAEEDDRFKKEQSESYQKRKKKAKSNPFGNFGGSFRLPKI
jgi:hypothetical protein